MKVGGREFVDVKKMSVGTKMPTPKLEGAPVRDDLFTLE